LTSSVGLSVSVRTHVGALELDVTFEVGAETLALVGPNGAGKSSLLAVILGVHPVDGGLVVIGGEPVVDTAKGLNVAIEHRHVGYVPQTYALFPHQTVRENIDFAVASARPRTSRPERRVRVDALLRALDLHVVADRKPTALSGGERQRVALARALSLSPRLLLLDEPLSALDVSTRDIVRSVLAEHLAAASLPTIVVTHDPSDARRLAQRILVLEAGRISQAGTWDELALHPATHFVHWFTSAR
jgi:molybdate transport system ATP-binding protein